MLKQNFQIFLAHSKQSRYIRSHYPIQCFLIGVKHYIKAKTG